MKLAEIIKLKGKTLSEVAEKMPNQKGGIGITRQAMSQIVNGSPRFDTLKDIANVLGMRVSDMVALMEDNHSLTILIEYNCRTYAAHTEEEVRQFFERINKQKLPENDNPECDD